MELPKLISNEAKDIFRSSRIFDPQVDTWLLDHCPTFVIPTMPFTVMVTTIMETAQMMAPKLKVVALRDVKVTNWLSFRGGPQEVRIESVPLERKEDRYAIKVSLSQFREARLKQFSRFEPFCSGSVALDHNYERWKTGKSLQESAHLRKPISGKEFYQNWFAGPRLCLIESLYPVKEGSVVSYLRRDANQDLPKDLQTAFLMDAALQTPAQMYREKWGERIHLEYFGVPHVITEAHFYTDLPDHGHLRCEAEFIGLYNGERFPEFDVHVFCGESANSPLWCHLRYVAYLMPKGRLLRTLDEKDTKFFFHDRQGIKGASLARRFTANEYALSLDDMKTADWLPGTVASVYLGTEQEMTHHRSLEPQQALEWLALQIAAKDLFAQRFGIHPSQVQCAISDDGVLAARSDYFPLGIYPMTWTKQTKEFHVRSEGPFRFDLEQIEPKRAFWRHHLRIKGSAVERISFAIALQFTKYIRLADPTQFYEFAIKPCIYLANHQTYSESFVFHSAIFAIAGRPVIFLAKKEHRDLWLGRLTELFYRYPGAQMFHAMEFVDRENPQELLRVASRLECLLNGGESSILIHVEGRRNLSAKDKVEKISSIWGDLSLKTGRPIFPVRFLGGLPKESSGSKYDFPYGYGKQSIHIGAPILPEELRKLPYAERSRFLRDSINNLGEWGEEDSLPSPEPDFESKVLPFAEYSGSDQIAAAIFQSLAVSEERPKIMFTSGLHQFEDLTDALIAAGELGFRLRQPTALILPETPEGDWMKEFASWLFGPRGPIVCTTKTLAPSTPIQVFGGSG